MQGRKKGVATQIREEVPALYQYIALPTPSTCVYKMLPRKLNSCVMHWRMYEKLLSLSTSLLSESIFFL